MDLAKARDFYTSKGYKLINVPTLVEADVINATCPPWGDFRSGSDLYHVASAEQGFVQLLKDGVPLYEPKYQAITACHRPSDKDRGEYYQEWFLKLELFTMALPEGWKYLMEDAKECYTSHLGYEPGVVQTEIGFDLELCGIEIGSYGSRKVSFSGRDYHFHYGTGFVPFRLSKLNDILDHMR